MKLLNYYFKTQKFILHKEVNSYIIRIHKIKERNIMNDKIEQLTNIAKHIGEAIIATTNTVEKLAEKINDISEKVERQEHQIQQQGYQIFALTESVQTLVDSQSESKEQLTRLTNIIRTLATNTTSSNQFQ